MDAIVIGGGLAGLSAAALLARGGAKVTVLERASVLGGRAASHLQDGAILNQGPHALYLGGPAAETLASLGVRWTGKTPKGGFFAERNGAVHALPTSLGGLLTSGALSFRGRLELARFFASLPSRDLTSLSDVTFADFAATHFADESARALARGLARLSTYAGDLDRLSAGAALAQVRRAMVHGVVYVDGGWESLVAGAATAARDAGVTIATGSNVRAIEQKPGSGAFGVLGEGGERRDADVVLLAVSPAACHALLPDSSALADAHEHAIPARAACLDVVLSSLPRPNHRLTLGLDHGHYLSLHSAASSLGAPGLHVFQLSKYLTRDDDGDARDELVALLSRAQPGWDEHVVCMRYLPKMTVSHAIPLASRRRTRVSVDDVPGAFVMGDWVGEVGMLLDAALASAAEAARSALAFRRGSPKLSRVA